MASALTSRAQSSRAFAACVTTRRPKALLPVRRSAAASVAVETSMQHQKTSAGSVIPVDAEEIPTLVNSEKLVVIDVYTNWCGPCKMIAPEVEKFAAEMHDNVIFAKLDCTTHNKNKKWALEQNVKALPTFILFKNGQRVNDMTGAKANNLRKLIEAHM